MTQFCAADGTAKLYDSPALLHLSWTGEECLDDHGGCAWVGRACPLATARLALRGPTGGGPHSISVKGEGPGGHSGGPVACDVHPGDWVLLSGPTSLVLLEPPVPERSSMIDVLWQEVVASSSMSDLAGRLASYPIDSLPSFAAFFWTENGMRSLVRGSVSVVDLASGVTVAQGEGIQTWTEVGLEQVSQVLVEVQSRQRDPVGTASGGRRGTCVLGSVGRLARGPGELAAAGSRSRCRPGVRDAAPRCARLAANPPMRSRWLLRRLLRSRWLPRRLLPHRLLAGRRWLLQSWSLRRLADCRPPPSWVPTDHRLSFQNPSRQPTWRRSAAPTPNSSPTPSPTTPHSHRRHPPNSHRYRR